MNYRVFIYIIMLFLAMFTLSGINFTNFFKKQSELQAKCFIILIAMGLSYLASEFILKFIELIG